MAGIGTNKPNSILRYRLTEDEERWLLEYRTQRTLLEQECIKGGVPINEVKHYWYKSKMFSIFAKKNQKTIEGLKDELIKDLYKYSPKFKPFKRGISKDSHCLVIDPADIHIGKLSSEYETGEKYNSSIAVQRAKKGISGLLQKTSGFKIDKIMLIIGNDILHVDNAKRTTTSGTPQDTDGQWYDNFLIAKQLYVDVIETLLPIADIHIVHNVSNHDYMTGWMLAETIKAYFRNCKQITFDTDMRHRKYFMYHDNLIGTTHGDGAKNHDLPLLMAQECKDWAKTRHRYIYTHHVHHKNAKEHIGVTIESSRSASGNDGWHSRNGYQHATQAIEAYLHDKKEGQIARFTQVV